MKSGLVRLAQIALKHWQEVTVIPIGISYSSIIPHFRSKAAICFGKPLIIDKLGKNSALAFNDLLLERMKDAEKLALNKVGRQMK